jgi:hypothetical protein
VPFWHIDTGMAALLILQTVVGRGPRRDRGDVLHFGHW